MNPRVTIIDVAKAAGVSKSTVSAALTNNPTVNTKTRDKVLAVAAELGYRPNRLARSLVRKNSGVIGVVVRNLRNPYYVDVVGGIEDACESLGLMPIISHSRDKVEVASSAIDQLLELQVQGIIVISSRISMQTVRTAAKAVPVAVIGRFSDDDGEIFNIVGDDFVGGSIGTAHLADLGHERIAYATTSVRLASTYRQSGYEQELNNRGLQPFTVNADNPRDTITALLQNGVTGVVAHNDVTAVALINAAHEQGIELPKALSIVGYDDTSLCDSARPTLTSINQPQKEMGRLAVEHLWSASHGENVGLQRIELKPSLHLRKSTIAI